MRLVRFCLAVILSLMLIGGHPQSAQADATLNPTDDSFVRDKAGERDTNFDESVDRILVSAQGFPTGVPIDIGYLRFDLSHLTGDTLTSATLRLYGRYAAPTATRIAIFSTDDDDWNGSAAGPGDETTLAFNNAPAEGSQLDSYLSGDGTERWWEFSGPNLMAYVQSQLPDNGGDGYVTIRVRAVSTGIVDIQSFEDRESGAVSGRMPALVLLGEPTDCDLASFTAAPLPGGIDVRWETVSEADILGFDLYRADDPQGEPVRLNATLIPSKQPGSPIGDQYQFVDRPLEPGVVYYYWLDCVHFDSSTARSEPVSAAAGPYRFYLPLVFK